MAFAPPFQRPFSATFDRRAAVAAVPAWWLSGGVAVANAVAVYQPKGAASLAASYDNIAAPGNGLADGTYDAAPGTAPDFATATGWTFVAASSQYLTTGVTPTADYTTIVRFSDTITTAACSLVGSYDGGAHVLMPSIGASKTPRWWIGKGYQALTTGVAYASGVMAGNRSACYRDGVSVGTTSGTEGSLTGQLYIGATNSGPGPVYLLTGKIQALAIYNTTLSAAQVLAITNAMNLL